MKGVEEEEEEEPEWMSFGPSDRYEFMELKGIDEHEMEREGFSRSDIFFFVLHHCHVCFLQLEKLLRQNQK